MGESGLFWVPPFFSKMILLCSKCNTQKDEDHFYRHPKMLSGFQSRCKDCTRSASKASYRADPIPTKVRAAERQRKVQIRTPSWSDKSEIYRIYRESQQLTLSTGVQHHVDHIIPINSDLVCGLHTEANLQIITAEENMRKSNHLLHEIL
jgi:5-methylcytosine-specific restriction endonuclease McrA